MNYWGNIGVNCNEVFSLKLPDAIKTLGVLFNQILFVSNQGGFFALLKSLILWASMTAGVRMLCLNSTIQL